MEELARVVNSLKEDVTFILRTYRDKEAERDRVNNSLAKLIQTREEYVDAIKLCQFAMDSEVDSLKGMEEMLSSLIQGVFDEGYEYCFEKTYKADKVTVSGIRPMVRFENGPWRQPLDHGGGMQNVVSWGLKFCFVLFNTDLHGIEPTMILDEPWVNLDNLPAVVDFINKVREQIPVRFIIVTNMDIKTLGEYIPHYFVVKNKEDISEVTRENG